MRTFGESIKKAFKDLIWTRWFVLGVFTQSLVALLCTIFGFAFMMITKSDAYSGINYDWAMNLLQHLLSYPMLYEALIRWFFQRAGLLLLAFLLVFVFFGVLSSKHRDKHFRKVLEYIGIVFFAANLIAMVFLIFIIFLTQEIRNPHYLETIMYIIWPFSVLGFIFMSALANVNRDRFNLKVAARIVVLKYLFFLIDTAGYIVISTVFFEGSSAAIHIKHFLSFLTFGFSVFVYAAVLDGETIFKSITKGASFFSRNFLYALLLSLVVCLTRPYIFTSYAWKLIQSSYAMSILDTKILPLLSPFVEITAFVIAATFYRLKLKESVKTVFEN